jgi:pentatricopeptide repeat protein
MSITSVTCRNNFESNKVNNKYKRKHSQIKLNDISNRVNECRINSVNNGNVQSERSNKKIKLSNNLDDSNLYRFNNSLFHAFRNDDLPLAERLFSAIQKNGLKPDNHSYETILNVYAKSGNLEKALLIYEEMKNEGIQFNAMIYAILLKTCAKSNSLRPAIKLYNEMTRKAIPPNEFIYSTLLHICCQRKKLAKGCQVFLEMLHHDLDPNKIVWGNFFDLLLKRDQIKDAKDFFCLSKLKNHLFSTQVKTERTTSIDCHNLTHGTACLLISAHLDENPNDAAIKIITGVGYHSNKDGYFRMKDAVVNFLLKYHPGVTVQFDQNLGVIWLNR